MLNYLYAILEAESRIALHAVGLDAGIGIIHTDQPARDSLALDLVEATRPAVDAYVLDLLATRPFSRDDIYETAAGECRLLPRLAEELAQTAPAWSRHVAPHAETIARLLARDAGLPLPPTTLTETNRRRARPPGERRRSQALAAPKISRSACAECGASIPTGQKRCATCHRTANADRLRTHQADETARRRTTGQPSQQPAVRSKIAQTQRTRWQTRQTSEPPSGFTGHPSEFQRLILPRLSGCSPRDLARATGLCPGYCAQVRDGKRIPHLRHWAAFQLVGLTT